MNIRSQSFSLEHIGHGPGHEVYTLVVYPNLVYDSIAQAEYRQILRRHLVRTEQSGWGLWIVCDISRISAAQTLKLFYQVALPFVKARIVTRVYGPFDRHIAESYMYTRARRLIEIAFQHTWMPNLLAALPPDFVALPSNHQLDHALRPSLPLGRNDRAALLKQNTAGSDDSAVCA